MRSFYKSSVQKVIHNSNCDRFEASFYQTFEQPFKFIY